MVDLDCETVREQVSALRDGEESDVGAADTHVRRCLACRSWLDDLDRVTSRHRLGVVRSPDLTATALREWDRRSDAGGRVRGWRLLLGMAGAASILVSVPRLFTGLGFWVWGEAHAHHVRELAAVELALGLGFVLAAWRPARFSAGLVPVYMVLVAVLGTVVTFDVLAGNTAWLSELVHVPLALGTVVLSVVQRRWGSDPGPDAEGWRPKFPPDEELAA